MNRYVIGVVGGASTGKGEITDFLRKQEIIHFNDISLSDILRELATQEGKSHKREDLEAVGTAHREQFGDDFLARIAVDILCANPAENYIVESIKHPDEIRTLKSEVNALILGVTMSPERRFAFMQERAREGDSVKWAAFHNLLLLEKSSTGHGIRVDDALREADVLIDNDGTLDDLHRKVAKVLLERGIYLEGRPPHKER
ncbi:MAG: hypothetical protein HZC02_02240 [Candidatus Levybacteria bacterium]|nr:hypothetical protein [Candidatus Levybacteria bacterium]